MTIGQNVRGLIVLGLFLALQLVVARVWKQRFQFEYHLTVKFVVFLLVVFLVMSVGVVSWGMQIWVGVDLVSWWLPPDHVGEDILYGFLTLIALGGSVLGGGWLAWLFGVRPPATVPSPSSGHVSWRHRIGRGVLIGFFGVAIASFQEETLFRGWLQPILITHLGVWWGLLGQAFIFAGSHLGVDPVTSWKRTVVVFCARVALGVVLGWLAFSRGTLLAAGIAHGILG